MKLPVLAGWIERRVVVNYRLDPDAMAALLPADLRPRLVRGRGVGAICLVRLRHVRPRPLPALMGVPAEMAAHLLAVEWDAAGSTHRGVYVARRYSANPFSALTPNRLFPGLQRPARVQVREWADGLSVSVVGRGGADRFALRASISQTLAPGSVFASIGEAADFLRPGACGPAPAGPAPEPLEMRTIGWHVEALRPDLVESAFFDDPDRFPAGTAEYDSALLMRSVPMRAPRAAAAQAAPRLSPT